MFGFTRDEQRVALFLIGTIAAGSALRLLVHYHPEWGDRLGIVRPTIEWEDLPASDSAAVAALLAQSDSLAAAEERRRAEEEAGPSPVDVNTADLAGLQRLPGIGPAKARAILERRTSAGPFRQPEDLLDVPGIGPRTLDRMRPYLRFEPEGSPGRGEGASGEAAPVGEMTDSLMELGKGASRPP